MATTKKEINDWFDAGKEEGFTHMLIVCDTYDHEDYPVFVNKGEDATVRARDYNNKDMQRVMECYNLTLDKETQLNEYRSHHYEKVE